MRFFNFYIYVLILCLNISNVNAQVTFFKRTAIDNLNFALSSAKTYDGGIVATGQDDGSGGSGACDFYIQKFDECGNTIWYKRYGAPLDIVNFTEGGTYIIEASNHDIILAGIAIPNKFKDSINQDFDGVIMRLDENGTLLWNKSFGNKYFSGTGEHALSAIELPNGNIAVAGFLTTSFRQTNYPYLLVLDANGNFIYDKLYTGNNNEIGVAWPHGLKLDNAGNLIISGSCTYTGILHNFFLKVNPSNGSALTFKLYSFLPNNGVGYDWKHGFTKLSSGDFAVLTTGYRAYNADKHVAVLYKIDSNGNLIWANGSTSIKFGNPNWNPVPSVNGNTQFLNEVGDENLSVLELNNGDLVTTGAVNNTQRVGVAFQNPNSPSLVTNYNYAYLRRYNPIGQLKFAKLFGDGNSICKAKSVFQTSDKGLFINGYTTGFGSGINSPFYYDPLFIKTDSTGSLISNCYTLNDDIVNVPLTPNAFDYSINVIDTADYYYNTSNYNTTIYNPVTDTICFRCSSPPTFTISTDSICAGDSFIITNTSKITTCGQSITLQYNGVALPPLDFSTQTSHTLSVINPGWYVMDMKNSCGSHKDSIYINPTPIASFVSDSVCFNTTSLLLDNSNGGGGTVVNYYWDVTGDNNVDFTSTNFVNVVMPLIGNNIVNYTVSTASGTGLTCFHDTIINVYTFPIPEANFTASNNCINTQPNSFDAISSLVAIGTITNYAWNFGDTNISSNNTISNISHTYNSANTYSVTLSVISNRGCKDSTLQIVEIYEKPLITITSSPSVCLGSSTTFTAQSIPFSGNVISWNWDINNSISSIETTGKESNYMYTSEGTHTISLVATTDKSCKDTITRTVYVNYNPIPMFIVNDPDGCSPHCVVFTDQTPAVTPPAQVVSWNWDFGNGNSVNSTSNTNQSQCYINNSSNQLALFTIILTTQTDSGCVVSNSKTDFITVYPKPIASYTLVPDLGNLTAPQIYFTNQSSDYTKWFWNFGDGSKIDSVNMNTFHTYNTIEINKYQSMLIVINEYGCMDTANALVNIGPDFVFYIPNTFTPNDDGLNDGFTGMGVGIVNYEMWIYNRWGTQIYYTNDIYKSWNGKMQGKDTEPKQDVYTWKVELKDVFDKRHSYVGHVTLLR